MCVLCKEEDVKEGGVGDNDVNDDEAEEEEEISCELTAVFETSFLLLSRFVSVSKSNKVFASLSGLSNPSSMLVQQLSLLLLMLMLLLRLLLLLLMLLLLLTLLLLLLLPLLLLLTLLLMLLPAFLRPLHHMQAAL